MIFGFKELLETFGFRLFFQYEKLVISRNCGPAGIILQITFQFWLSWILSTLLSQSQQPKVAADVAAVAEAALSYMIIVYDHPMWLYVMVMYRSRFFDSLFVGDSKKREQFALQNQLQSTSLWCPQKWLWNNTCCTKEKKGDCGPKGRSKVLFDHLDGHRSVDAIDESKVPQSNIKR